MNCPHEDDIEYGKQISLLDDKYHISNILCATCGMVGTQLEMQDEDDEDHYYSIDEVWHAPTDYYRSDLATNMFIGLTDKPKEN